MQINNNIISTTNTNAVEQTLIQNTPSATEELSQGISPFIITDQVTISEEGLNLYKSLIEEDSLDLNNVIIASTDAEFVLGEYRNYSEQFVHNMFIDAALDYKKQLDQINSTEETVDTVLTIKLLNETYANDIKKNINEIANVIDHYFDGGRVLNDIYFENPLDDLFDKVAFKEHLTKLVLEIKDYVVNAKEPLLAEDINNKLMNGAETTSLEKMSYSDMKVLYEFIKEPIIFDDSINKNSTDPGKYIATNEKSKNQRVRDLNLSSQIKNSMYMVHRRISDGEMRSLAFLERIKAYKEELQEADRLLQELMKKLYKISLRIQSISDNFGISPNNKRLMTLLSRSNDLTENYNDLKHSKTEKENDFIHLNTNKHTIVNTDTYKRIKSQYDEEMNTKKDDSV